MGCKPAKKKDTTQKKLVVSVFHGAGGRNRTDGPFITNELLYR